MDALSVFSPASRAWFERAFREPTPAQTLGWPAIASGEHTLIQAPTGSGKTLAAFLYGIDRLNSAPGEGLRLLYVSPLKALNYDIERNLRGPLAGLRSQLRVGVRTGDTPQKERAAMLRDPPDILITTPESLYLLLTSRARETLAPSSRSSSTRSTRSRERSAGRTSPLSVERLDHLLRKPASARRAVRDPAAAGGDRPLRLGRPADPSGRRGPDEGARPGGRRAARGHARAGHEAGASIWPSIYPECSASSRRTARRSSSSTTAASPSGWRSGSTSWPRRRSRAPTTARWRASSGSRSRSC